MVSVREPKVAVAGQITQQIRKVRMRKCSQKRKVRKKCYWQREKSKISTREIR